MKNKLFFFFSIITLFFACEEEPIFEPVSTWQAVIPQYAGYSSLYLDSHVKGNRLITTLPAQIAQFDTLGNLIEMGFVGQRQERFKKNTMTNKYMSQKIAEVEWIQLTTNNYLDNVFNEYFLEPKEVPNYSFTHFNFEYDVGAFNEDGVFLTSVADSADLSKMYLLIVKMKNEIEAELDTNFGCKVIELPIESNTKIHHIKSIGDYFYVSTTEKTYWVDANGNYQMAFNKPMTDFFQYQDKYYADNGNVVYSSDNGLDWNIVRENLNYDGFRTFFVADNRLFFYDLDEIQEVNFSDFSYQSIPNRELKDKKITSATEFYGKLYVTTWDGLFMKPIEHLNR